jgi:hypothetical protein
LVHEADLNGSLDSDVVVGRIYPEIIKGEPKWLWFLQTEPAPNSGVAGSLEDAKAGFKARYQQVKARAGPAAIGALPRRPRDRCTSHSRRPAAPLMSAGLGHNRK